MNITWFIIFNILGAMVFLVADAKGVLYAGAYFIFYCVILAYLRRSYLKKPPYHFWNPLNLADYFKKP